MLMKQAHIYSLIVTMLNKFGGLFILQQAYHRLSQFLICLGIDFIIKMKKITMAGMTALCWVRSGEYISYASKRNCSIIIQQRNS
jgi:hypothetical protein